MSWRPLQFLIAICAGSLQRRQQALVEYLIEENLVLRKKLGRSPLPLAHDLETGRAVWKTLRTTRATAEQCDSYTTPLLMNIDGQRQLVIMGGNQLDGYDPANGRQLWFLPGLTGGRTVPSPTAGNGLIYAVRGLRGDILAVRSGGRGQLPGERIAWTHRQNSPDTCCPLLYRGLLFTVSDDGIAQCLDAKTGRMQWRTRLKGPFKASPIAADGRILFASTTGVCTVIAAGRKLRQLAANPLDDQIIASPAIANGTIYLRGRKRLYAIRTGSDNTSK